MNDFADPPPGYKSTLRICPICYDQFVRSPKHILNEDFCICDSCDYKSKTDDEIKFRIEELLLWAM
jgi:hypothetical protein